MKTETLSAMENAREDGRDCASEWQERDTEPRETAAEWRARCRANIVRDFESSAHCALCSSGTSRADFDKLLAEWDRGFDEIMNTSAGPTLDESARADTVKRLAGLANAVTGMLEVYGIIPAAEQPKILAISSGIADELARELAALARAAE